MAASVAIHVVILWPGFDETPALPGMGSIVEISLMEISNTEIARQKPPLPKPLQKSASQQSQRSASKQSALPQKNRAHQILPGQQQAPDTVASISASPNSEVRESLVRNHLERFKHYPSSARRRAIVGDVQLTFQLHEQGRVSHVKILQGSGYAVLDQAALETVRRAEPFPADGGSYQFRLNFRAS